MSKAIVSFLVVAMLISSAICAEADYSDQANWGGSCNTGTQQTPIDINTKMLDFCRNIGYYKFTLMCNDYPMTVTGLDMSVDSTDQAFAFFFDPIKNTYEAYQGYNLHFHTLSEHTVNGDHMDAEMHIKMRPVNFDVLPPEALGEYAGYDLSQSTNTNHFHSVLSMMFKVDDTATVDFFDGRRTVTSNG